MQDPGGRGLSWLLRPWRTEVGRLSQPALARRIAVSESAVSMWENGRRRPDFDQLVALDGLYRADGALVDLALALGTLEGLPPRHTWAHNPQGPSGPHWAWLRPMRGAGQIWAWLRWGAFGMECKAPCDGRGVFVTVSTSMPNPAAWFHFREPGWVDFGRGLVPPDSVFRSLMRSPTPKSHMPVTPQQGWYQLISLTASSTTRVSLRRFCGSFAAVRTWFARSSLDRRVEPGYSPNSAEGRSY